MRRRLAWVFVALAVMLAVGFLVPLGRSVKSQAELRALAGAQSDARGVATALAAVVTTTGRTPAAADAAFIISSFETQNIVILLPDDTLVGGGVPVERTGRDDGDGSCPQTGYPPTRHKNRECHRATVGFTDRDGPRPGLDNHVERQHQVGVHPYP